MSNRRDRLERFFGIDGANPVLAIDLAMLCIQESDNNRAKEVLEQVRQAGPLGAAQANEFGQLYGRLGEWATAVDVLGKAVREDPAAAELWFNLGYAQLCNDDAASAVTSLGEAVRLRPEDARFHYYRGLAAYDADNYDEARAALCEVLRLDPANDDAAALLGTVALASGDTVQAHAQAERLLNSAKASFDGIWLKAQLAVFDFELEEALDWIAKAERIEPRNAQVTLLKGQSLLGLQRYTEAEAALAQAAADDGSALPWTGLGWCAMMQNDPQAAENAFVKAVESDPESAEGYVGLALIQMSDGRHEAGRQNLARALELDPQHPLALAVKAAQAQGDDAGNAQKQLKAALEEYRVSANYKMNISRKLMNSKLTRFKPPE